MGYVQHCTSAVRNSNLILYVTKDDRLVIEKEGRKEGGRRAISCLIMPLLLHYLTRCD